MIIKIFLIKLAIIIIVICSISCRPIIYISEEKVVYKKDTIDLYKTSLFEIEHKLGFSNDSLDWNSYSYEKFYFRKTISFSYKQKDSLRIINWINLNTRKNKIYFNENQLLPKKPTVKDIFEMFGEGEIIYKPSYTGLIIQYDYFEFIIKTRPKNKTFLNEFSDGDCDKFYNEFIFNQVKEIEM